jgi:signal transduction histidine kinase
LSAFKENASERVINVENFNNEAPVLMLKVSDTGPGIPAEVFPKIFQPYFTTKGPLQGTGLGLSIVQRLIKTASGIMRVRSTPGEGTVFSLYIPATRLTA